MKGKKSLIVLGALALITSGTSFVSCNKSIVDSSKTQLYILNYQGGYGKKYIENAATRYAELYKDKSFEDGKKGLQIIIDEEKAQPNLANLKASNYQLIIFEGMVYQDLRDNDLCADITEYITKANPYETSKTIESKMFDEQKKFFNESGKYYVIPNYVGSFGIVYNKTVFKDKGFYFVSDYKSKSTLAEKFTNNLEDLSVGPDGQEGTYDDGLPVTYQDYYDLCNFIASGDSTPLIWMGKNSQNYLTDLTSAMIANYDGYDAYKSNYDMDGTFEACKIDQDGKVVMNEGIPATEQVTVHPDKVDNKYDGYEIQRSASKYYAFDFIKNIVDHKTGAAKASEGVWAYDKLYDTLTNVDAQRKFINSQFGTLDSFKKKDKPVAMLFEGNWWESEASETFSTLTDKQKTELDYGWMPLPRSEHSANNKTTVLNSLTSYMFVKSGLKDFQTKIAADFLQYLNTDEAYNEFTAVTSAIKSFNYTLTEETESKMSKFAKDFWNYFKTSEKIFPESHNTQFIKSLASQQLSRRYWRTADKMSWPSLTFENDSSVTAATYLADMYKAYKDSIWVK